MERVKSGFLKEINRELERAYGIKLPEDLIYFRRKEKIYAVCKDFEKVKDILDKLNVENIGIKILHVEKDGIWLTIEGVHLFGKNAKKNVVEIENAEEFMAGRDIKVEKSFDHKFVIVKSKKDFLGSARVIKGNILRPYISKERRIPEKYIIGRPLREMYRPRG